LPPLQLLLIPAGFWLIPTSISRKQTVLMCVIHELIFNIEIMVLNL
jgi:hypothetical protein